MKAICDLETSISSKLAAERNNLEDWTPQNVIKKLLKIIWIYCIYLSSFPCNLLLSHASHACIFHRPEIRRNEVLLIIATDSVATIVTQLARVM